MRKKQNVNEFLNRIKKNSKINLNEVRYKPIIEDDYQFDNIPDDVYPTNGYADAQGNPLPNAGNDPFYIEEQGEDDKDNPPQPNLPPPGDGQEGGEMPLPPEGGQEGGMPPPPGGGEGGGMNPEGGDMPSPPQGNGNEMPPPPEGEEPDMSGNEPAENPEINLEKTQNDIIKNNTLAMQSISNKLKSLDQFINQVTHQLDVLNKKVKEVEEPSDSEKLMQRKDVSYPFYFNLNDYWDAKDSGDTRKELDMHGIKELPDGTYVADFDDLPIDNTNDEDDILV